ncbi:hypothetical protein Poly30_06740 [Planctomycetes bacterium Poly30]|uniref:Uncharacterized protein n=1 Tax=Saltatorellus ferox TaxID=2528018 RepID=A0A518EM64_9BACT|nr:hypothetical protein Poly30_06740 [Planctomycetes bacterium Poly30]
MDADPIALAESFLQEAVYRSRGDQAGATLLSAGSASCGLGEKPSVVLDLSPRAEELYAKLFGDRAVELDSLKDVMAAWVKRQDALDRKRNHFLKDFRNAHGFDRNGYSEEQLELFESGLDAINGEITEARHAAAEALLRAGSGSAR